MSLPVRSVRLKSIWLRFGDPPCCFKRREPGPAVEEVAGVQKVGTTDCVPRKF